MDLESSAPRAPMPPAPRQEPERTAERTARARAQGDEFSRAAGSAPSSRRESKSKGFVLDVEHAREPLVCGDIRGFREATAAACDPRAPAPPRLVIVAPESATAAWLDGWAIDTERVRRTVTFCRRFDGKAVTAIATLCAHGYGVETALSVESVFVSTGQGASEILRSGVHAKADVEAALARYDAEERARAAEQEVFPSSFFLD